MKILLRIILGLLTIAFGIVLVLADIMSYTQPISVMYLLCPLTLFFSSLFILISVLAIYWAALRKWIMFGICLLFLLISLPNIFKTYTFSPKNQTVTEQGSISLMSYNVHLFNWFGEDRKDNDGLKTLDYIRSANPDVVCMQEFLYYPNGTHNLEFVKNELKAYPYSYIKVLNNSKKAAKCVATFSKYPIVKSEDISFGAVCHGGIITSIKVGNEIINVVNVYLKSNQLTQQEKDLFPDANNNTKEQSTSIITKIYNKLVSASLERSKEAEHVSEAVMPYSHNQILCGDFNDIPASYTYRTLCDGRKDAFLELSQWSTGNTFNEGIYNFRIDYILLSENIRPLSFEIDKQKTSDHYPLTLTFKTK